MHTIHKGDGFEGQKLLVLPDDFLANATAHPLVKPLYVTDIGFFPNARYHYRKRRSGTSAYIFIYCATGSGWAVFNDKKKIYLHKDTLLIIPDHTPHAYGADDIDPWSIYWFHLEGEAVESFVQLFALCDSIVKVPPSYGTKIIDMFEECYNMLQYKWLLPRYYMYVSQLLGHLLGMIALFQSEPSQDEKKHALVEDAIQYMIAHVQSSVTLDELANHVGLSKSHFVHLFKQSIGYSPVNYYLRLKIQRSCQYLTLTNHSIKEISSQVGIEDPYYFSRLFHHVMGCAPSDYRSMKTT